MFSIWHPHHVLLAVFLHTVAIYIFLIVSLRFMGRRHLGQLTVLDLVIVILLGSAVETAMVAGNTSLPAGLVSSSTLLALNYGLGLILLRSKKLRHLIGGGPILLVHFGHFVEENLLRAGLTHADVLQAIHERDEAGIESVKFAVLEVDGAINVVPMSAKSSRSPQPIGHSES